MAIVLKHATATCRICGEQKHQIDTSGEHAREVVIAAMNRHMAEAHPDECPDPTEAAG